MNYFLIPFIVGALSIQVCSASLTWSVLQQINTVTNGNTGNTINTGGMDTLGYAATILAQGGRRKKTGESFIRIFNEEYKFGTGKSWSAGALLWPSHNDTESFGFSISLGGSLKTLNMLFAGAPSNNTVYAFKDTRVHWSQQQILQVDDSNRYDLFGFSVATDKFDPHRLIVGAPGDDDFGLSSGSAYVFSGSPTAKYWSVGQKLQSTDFHSQDQFGYDVTMGDGMAAVTSPGNCKVYLYTEDIPGTQRAHMTDVRLLPEDAERDLSSRENMASSSESQSSVHFDPAEAPPPKMLMWTEQQVLQFPGCSGQLSVAQYKNKLVVGVPNSDNSFTNNGRAYFLEATRYVGQCGSDMIPRSLASFRDIMALRDNIADPPLRFLRSSADIKLCTTTKWTQMQLFAYPTGVLADCQFFGTDVDIYKDTLIISSKVMTNSPLCDVGDNPGQVAVYQYFDNAWNFEQTLTSGSILNTDGYGSNEISVYGLDIAVSTEEGRNRVYTYYADGALTCVLVYLGDQFGDGWSGADLIATDSSGRQERFTHKCDSILYSGFRLIRWCPDSEFAYGDVTFEIVGAEKAPFNWEIAWHIYLEQTGLSVYGDINTKMVVNYDVDRVMRIISTEKRLEPEVINNKCSSYSSCQLTPAPTRYPTRAPSPGPTRAGSSPATHAVTTDPEAKTAIIAYTLFDSNADSWFADYNMETTYSITSMNGSKVHARGTMCQTQSEVTCYIELPVNEKLAFRISGAMDTFGAQHNWRIDACDQTGKCAIACVGYMLLIEFCAGTAGTNQQLDFHLSSDGTCTIDKLYSASLYCKDKEHIIVAIGGIILLHGLSYMKALPSADAVAVTYALSTLVRSKENLYVNYTYGQDGTFDALKVDFNMEVPTALFGLDGTDPDNLELAVEAGMGLISDGVNSGEFTRLLEQYATLHASASDLLQHGWVELESVGAGILRDHAPLTSAPSPFWEDVPTMAPSHLNYYTPQPSSLTGTTTGNAAKQSSGHHGTEDSSDWGTVFFIVAGVVVVGLVFMYVVRNQDETITAGVLGEGGGRKKPSRKYKELSTDSLHRVEGGEEEEDDDWEDAEEEEEGDKGSSNHESIKKILLAVAAESQKETKTNRFAASVESGSADDEAAGGRKSKHYKPPSSTAKKSSSKSSRSSSSASNKR
jgi:hypothetical protein